MIDDTQNYIDNHKAEFVKSLFNDCELYGMVMEKNDVKRIEKLLTIKSLVNFWDKVRQFTKHITGCHSVNHWQSLAELRYIQIDLQQNYDKETLTKKIKGCNNEK